MNNKEQLTAAKKILRKLNKEGHEAYIVGGFVRDLISKNEHSNDIDISTSAKPEDVKKIFNTKTYTLHLENEKYGVINIEYGKFIFEVTTFRIEISYFKNRFPVIRFTKNLYKDSQRRDFTMNSLYMDANDKLIDPHNALIDISTKVINCIGFPKTRFEEDSLRILRAIKYQAKTNFNFEKKLEKSIIDNFNLINNLSDFRITTELREILRNLNSKTIQTLMKLKHDNILFKNISPKILEFSRLEERFFFLYLNNVEIIKYISIKNSEKKLYEQAKQLIDFPRLSKVILFKTPLKTVRLANDFSKKNLLDKYNELLIHDLKELKLTPIEIEKESKIKIDKWYSSFLDDLLEKILNSKIKNNKTEIKKFLKTWLTRNKEKFEIEK